jgi:hypothetical protein
VFARLLTGTGRLGATQRIGTPGVPVTGISAMLAASGAGRRRLVGPERRRGSADDGNAVAVWSDEEAMCSTPLCAHTCRGHRTPHKEPCAP